MGKKEELEKKIASAPILNPDYLNGLTQEEVKEREKLGLANKSPKEVTKSYLKILTDNLFSFFNIIFFTIAILMGASGISTPASYFFLLPLLANIALGLYADVRARILVNNLRVMSSSKCKTVREGVTTDLDNNELVLSDIVFLEQGDQIPCDGEVVEGRFSVDESLVTGESEEVRKKVGSEVLSGTYVRSGKGYIKVTKVGVANYANSLQSQAKKLNRPKSEIKSSCLKIFGFTGIVAIVVGVIMATIYIVRTVNVTGGFTRDDFQGLMQSMSGSLVAMIPAGLYLLTSLTLSIGLINLSQKNMNVQELYCIEVLARVDTVCLDKTGTLTDGKMTVKDFINFTTLSDKELGEIIGSALKGIGDTNATATALREYFNFGDASEVKATIPFDSLRKYSAATLEEGTLIFGAPEFIEGARASERAAYEYDHLLKRGYRVLGIFYSKKEIKNNEIPSKPELAALVSLSDHVKEDAPKIIKWFIDNGVTVKVITGDNEITGSEIAREAGIPHAERAVSMVGKTDEDIEEMVEDTAVFGRVTPEQKSKLIAALKKQGHVVAMTGDGINDILALKTADCSIAMQSGSAAARNASHIVSVDNDFSKFPDVVAEGRRVINNLQRTGALFLSKTFFAIVMSLIFLMAYALGGPMYPFRTSHMILWELITIGAGGFFLSLEPTNEKIKGKFLDNILVKVIPSGLVEVIAAAIPLISSAISPGYMDFHTAVSASVILFSLTSYLALFVVCHPFNKFRKILYAVLSAAGIVILVFDYFRLIPFLDMGITFNFNGGQWMLIVLTFLAIIGVYIGLIFFVRRLMNKEEREDED